MAEQHFHQNNRIRELINAEIARRNLAGIEPETWYTRPYRPGSNKRRRYLGGSVVGNKCVRDSWYSFHWATTVTFEPRVLRLFDRGHREEERMVTWLRMIGVEVQEYDPDTIPTLWHHPESDDYVVVLPPEITDDLARDCLDVTGTFHEWIARSRGVAIPEPKQFSFTAFDGHHRGNTDGRARNVPDQELWGIPRDEWILTEYKTHGDKSFTDLTIKGVHVAKPDHWAQMQRYMEKMNLRLALYGAVNKNTDDLYFEFVPFDPGAPVRHDATAKEAIYSLTPPKRISNSASWYDCKFCDHRPMCHFGAPLEKNCRTCTMSRPHSNGNWFCTRWGKEIPHAAEAEGCGAWVMITD